MPTKRSLNLLLPWLSAVGSFDTDGKTEQLETLFRSKKTIPPAVREIVAAMLSTTRTKRSSHHLRRFHHKLRVEKDPSRIKAQRREWMKEHIAIAMARAVFHRRPSNGSKPLGINEIVIAVGAKKNLQESSAKKLWSSLGRVILKWAEGKREEASHLSEQHRIILYGQSGAVFSADDAHLKR